MEKAEAVKFLLELPDEELSTLAMTAWQYTGVSASGKDPDGAPIGGGGRDKEEPLDREVLQNICWDKFHENPQVNTSIRGLAGRLTGRGFETVCYEDLKIQEVIEEIELDKRNRLYNYWPKYTTRAKVEGELILCLTCHKTGFIETDFIDPSVIQGGEHNDGVIYHPKKTGMPLAYIIKDGDNEEIILSIFCARYPELVNVAAQADKANFRKNKIAHRRIKAFEKTGGYYRFIVEWDQSFITRRNTSYLKTILEWLNQYENLKKYEIEHKKSAGSYLWVVTMEDPKAFRRWLKLSDEQKRDTGLMAKKTPGGTMVLPPGMKLQVVNPQLPNISESDTDIMHMVTSGLNEAEDVTTGQSKGTFASVKASRGPMSDRIADEVAYFERFLRHDFWSAIFFLKSAISDFPEFFNVRRAIGFKKQEPVFRNVKKRPEQLLEISFPVTEMIDVEARARAHLGVKHGSTNDTLGIPNKVIADNMGYSNYNKLRLEHATEEDKYPELVATEDAESVQEKTEAEPKNTSKKDVKGKK